MDAGDAFLAVYDDASHTYIALISTAAGTPSGEKFDDAIVTNIAKLDGTKIFGYNIRHQKLLDKQSTNHYPPPSNRGGFFLCKK